MIIGYWTWAWKMKQRKYWNNSSSRVSTSAFAFSLYDLEVQKGQEVQMGLTNDAPNLS